MKYKLTHSSTTGVMWISQTPPTYRTTKQSNSYTFHTYKTDNAERVLRKQQVQLIFFPLAFPYCLLKGEDVLDPLIKLLTYTR